MNHSSQHLIVSVGPPRARANMNDLHYRTHIAIIALPKVVVANSPFRVDEILGGPKLVIKRLPDPIVAVDGDRKSNVQIANGIFYVNRFVLERKLRRMRADHDQDRKS